MTRTTRHTDRSGGVFDIRPFEEADRSALEAMYDAFSPKRGAQGLPPAGTASRRRWLDTVLERGIHLVVVVAGRVMGHGMLIPFDGGRAELANFLHQDIRYRGIGTTLNRALLEAAREAGLRRLWLSVEPGNRPAVRSYETVGFRHRPFTVWAPEVEMEIDLEEE